MKRALILVNPYLATQSEAYQPRRLAESLGRLGVRADIVPNAFLASVSEKIEDKFPFSDYDFCVYLDKDKYLPRILEKRGMRLFNRAKAVELCDDKMLTHIALSGLGIPMPETYPAPLCYKTGAEPLRAEITSLGFPLVVKECFGSLGKQVFLAKDEGELEAIRRDLNMRPHLFQRYVAESAGVDLRVVCVGGEVVACMKRISCGDFRSNVELGGRGERYTPDRETAALCKRVSDALDLDYCGIDLLFGKDGFLVCEVNSNAFFGGIERVTGADVARAYAEYLCRVIYGT